jgi:hypothetical protein
MSGNDCSRCRRTGPIDPLLSVGPFDSRAGSRRWRVGDLLRKGPIEACFDERVPILVLYWGDPAPYVADAHRRGMKVFRQVSVVDEAVARRRPRVDAVIGIA